MPVSDKEIKVIEEEINEEVKHMKIVKKKVIEFLKKNKDQWFTAEEISEAIREELAVVNRALLSLYFGPCYVRRIKTKYGYYKYKLEFTPIFWITVVCLILGALLVLFGS